MRSTLFYIPAEVAGQPIFGFGWLLLGWIVFGIVLLLWAGRRPEGKREVSGYLPLLIIVAVVIAFLLPSLVEYGPKGEALGVPLRGFGVMFMLATIAGVGLAAYRARQVGLDPELIYSLAFAMFVPGIIGAPLFYVIQYWHELAQFSPQGWFDWKGTLQSALNVTKGGLVVYGSVLAAVPAAAWFCWRHRLPILKVGDVIAPCMLVGLALGRIGCFLNGCCFGGVCLTADYALAFPADSPPYQHQEGAGWRSGVWLEEQQGKVAVAYVAPHSEAARHLRVGDQIVRINGGNVQSLPDARRKLASAGTALELETEEGRVERWQNAAPPARSVPIHPTQLYAAIDASLLALVLWFFYAYRRHDGEVFAILFTVHPISRFLLEMIRSDEPGQFGTALTISQWLSLALLAGACVLWWYIERRPSASALAPAS